MVKRRRVVIDPFDVFTMTGRLPSGRRVKALGVVFDAEGVVVRRRKR